VVQHRGDDRIAHLASGLPVVFGTDSYSVTVDPTSQFLYVANNGSANVSGFRFDGGNSLPSPARRSPPATPRTPLPPPEHA